MQKYEERTEMSLKESDRKIIMNKQDSIKFILNRGRFLSSNEMDSPDLDISAMRHTDHSQKS